MGTAATRAKRKWNNEHYTNVTVAMNPELAAKLKMHCMEKSISVTSVISGLVAEHLDAEAPAPKGKPQKKLRTTVGGGVGRYGSLSQQLREYATARKNT